MSARVDVLYAGHLPFVIATRAPRTSSPYQWRLWMLRRRSTVISPARKRWRRYAREYPPAQQAHVQSGSIGAASSRHLACLMTTLPKRVSAWPFRAFLVG